jgi:3-dehydroquinate dehydratase
MRPQRDDYPPPVAYGSMSLEQIQEGVSAEAVSYAAGLLVEAIRNYDSENFSSAHQKLTLTEAQMIAANVIAHASARLDDATLQEQLARVRKAIREVKP